MPTKDSEEDDHKLTITDDNIAQFRIFKKSLRKKNAFNTFVRSQRDAQLQFVYKKSLLHKISKKLIGLTSSVRQISRCIQFL